MLLARRELLIGGAATTAFLAPLATRQLRGEGGADPRSFGARGDGLADDTHAVRQALDHAFDRNIPVDGGGARFAVNGNISVAGRARPWIRQLNLKQLSPADDRKTLFFARCEQIRIDQLEIDVGNSKSAGYFNVSGGLWIDGGRGHDVRNVDVHGHGRNSLIAIWNSAASTYANLHAHDGAYDARSARDDQLQGIFLCRNTNCIIQSPRVSNLSGNANPRFPNRFTRGIAACSNQGVHIIDANVDHVDQGIDLTGSDGNRDCTIVRAHCVQCTAVGVKLANSAVGCRVSDSIAERCGLTGFLASGPAEAGLRYKTRDCDFIRCTSYDAGANGFADAAPHAGFRVERNRFDMDFPMGIRFVECRAIDRQSHPTMDYGFYEDVRESGIPRRPNQLIDCTSSGHLKAMRSGHWS